MHNIKTQYKTISLDVSCTTNKGITDLERERQGQSDQGHGNEFKLVNNGYGTQSSHSKKDPSQKIKTPSKPARCGKIPEVGAAKIVVDEGHVFLKHRR